MTPDRRPIAARELKASRWAASWLVARGVSPNTISIAGMLCAVAAGEALLVTPSSPWYWLAAAALIQLRLLANMLDGMVAIESNTASPVGELYNEIPDRVSDSAVLIGLGYAVGGSEVLGYAAALAALMTAYVRAMGKAAGAGHEFAGPMAKQHRMFLVTVLALYCAFAPPMQLPTLALEVMIVGCAATVIVRLIRISRRLRSVR